MIGSQDNRITPTYSMDGYDTFNTSLLSTWVGGM